LRALVGFAARHAQFDDAAVGEQATAIALRHRAARPSRKSALDEEHVAIRVAGGPGRRANRIRRLADRAAAHRPIRDRRAPGLAERGGQLIEVQARHRRIISKASALGKIARVAGR
jgi:hypothetical protein